MKTTSDGFSSSNQNQATAPVPASLLALQAPPPSAQPPPADENRPQSGSSGNPTCLANAIPPSIRPQSPYAPVPDLLDALAAPLPAENVAPSDSAISDDEADFGESQKREYKLAVAKRRAFEAENQKLSDDWAKLEARLTASNNRAYANHGSAGIG